MSAWPEDSPTKGPIGDEKGYTGDTASEEPDATEVVEHRDLHRDLQGRHMQMIAVGGAIGSGLFVGSGQSFEEGGPASVLIGFMLVGFMMYFVMQALAELTVMFPVSGAFFTYAVRFVSPAWGFAMGWDYAISWLTVLPFELTAAGLTLQFWKASADLNIGIWVTIFLVVLVGIQVFGVRGYGETEFVLSVLKIVGVTVFIIVGIVIDCGGTPGGHYIGAKYWYNPGAFVNGFKGFCSVLVNAAFAFGGTELVGLAAAEAANPLKTIPRATKQVLYRIAFFYIVALLIAGLLVPYDNKHLLHGASSDADTADSIFVLAIKKANLPVLPSLMNGLITISVLSVANSATFGSSRTIQALASRGMAPKFLAYVDKKGRPLACIILQVLFGCLAYVQESANASGQLFDWLLALSGIVDFFVWGSICFCHIRFRAGWKAQGHSLDEIPYKASFGVIGSWIGLSLNILFLIGSFYVDAFPLKSDDENTARKRADYFFEEFLAGPLILALYIFWKIFAREGYLLIPASKMDVTSGVRHDIEELRQQAAEKQANKSKPVWYKYPIELVRTLV